MSLLQSGLFYTSNMEAIIRLLLACLVGGIIGFEREKSNHPAGLRTHLIVCLGSCMIMILTANIAMQTSFDTSRLAQGVISGIGFLGAGTIIRDGNKVRGLTTAASIWTTACLGLTIGAGMLIISIIITLVLVFALIVLGKLENIFFGSLQKSKVVVETTEIPKTLDLFYSSIYKYGGKILKVDVTQKEEISHLQFDIIIPNITKHNQVIKLITKETEIISKLTIKKIQ